MDEQREETLDYLSILYSYYLQQYLELIISFVIDACTRVGLKVQMMSYLILIIFFFTNMIQALQHLWKKFELVTFHLILVSLCTFHLTFLLSYSLRLFSLFESCFLDVLSDGISGLQSLPDKV